jgi:DNA-binding MarR family transcriptional regulator
MTIEQILANRESIGSGFWELLVIAKYGPRISGQDIAAKSGKNPRTAMRNVRAMERAGVLKRVLVPGQMNEYEIVFDR